MFVGNSRRNDLIFPKYFLSFFSAFQFYIWMNLKVCYSIYFQKIGTCTFVVMFYFPSQNLPRHTDIRSRIFWFKHCLYFLVLIVIFFNLGNLGQFLIDYRQQYKRKSFYDLAFSKQNGGQYSGAFGWKLFLFALY